MKLMDRIDRQPARIGFGWRGSAAGTATATGTAVLGSRVEIAATVLDSRLQTWLGTVGFGAPGDGGGALYVRAASEPAHPGKIRSADGSWWELAPDPAGVSPEQFGAVGGLDSDNSAAVQDWLDYLVARQVFGIARGAYRMNGTVTLSDPDNIHIDARGSDWVLLSDVLMIDVNGRADPIYQDNESRQNFSWRGGEFRCWVAGPAGAAAFRMLGMRKAVLAPDKVDGFATGLILGGKDTVLVENVKFFNNDIDIEFPPWSLQGGPLEIQLRNLHHSHGGKTAPCVKSYVPLNDCEIISCSYNLGSNAISVAVDLQKAVLLGVSGGAGTWVPGETVTGATSGATMVLDEVYDHAHPFPVAQNTRWLVGHTRAGSFTAGETLTGATSGATAVLGADDDYVAQNPSWTQFKFGGSAHFEVGSGGAGATGIRIRDRIGTGARTWNIDIDVGKMYLSKGGAVGVELQNVQHATVKGYFSLENGGTDTVLRTDPDCRDIALLKPFVAPHGTIDLGGMDRAELDMGAFDRILDPTDFGASGTLAAGATPTTPTAIPDTIAAAVAGFRPRAYDLRVSLTATAAAAAGNVRWRAFPTGKTAAAAKQSLQIGGGLDGQYYWQTMRVMADAGGQFEWDAHNDGGGTVAVAPQIVGVRY